MTNYAIIRTGGKQYEVRKGDKIQIEKIEGEAGALVHFEEVLLHVAGAAVEIGMPHVAGAKVSGKILSQFKDDKVLVFKRIPKKRHQRRKGHRQNLTEVEITGV